MNAIHLTCLLGASLLIALIVHLICRIFWILHSWILHFRKQGVPVEPSVPVLGQLTDHSQEKQDNSSNFWAYKNSLLQKHGPVHHWRKGSEFCLCFHKAQILQHVCQHHAETMAKDAGELSLLQKLFFMWDCFQLEMSRLTMQCCLSTFPVQMNCNMLDDMCDMCQDLIQNWMEAKGELDMAHKFPCSRWKLLPVQRFPNATPNCKPCKKPPTRH